MTSRPNIARTALPDELRAGSGLERIDYCDAHVVEHAGASLSAEQWVREILDHAPPLLRRGLPPGWWVLGLRHGSPRSSEHVLGWPIRHNSDDRIVLGARSRIGMPAELMFARVDGVWMFATLVQHDNAAVRGLWRTIAPIHRQTVRHLLRSAAARVTPGMTR